jgi:hypothetical protein
MSHISAPTFVIFQKINSYISNKYVNRTSLAILQFNIRYPEIIIQDVVCHISHFQKLKSRIHFIPIISYPPIKQTIILK